MIGSSRVAPEGRPLVTALRTWCLLVVVALTCLGCSGATDHGPLWADPGLIHLAPGHTRVEVEIHNRTGTARPVTGFTLGGPDWDVLRIVDAELPRTIPAHDSVVLELELSAASLKLEPGIYRSASAALSFASNRHEYEVPIEFVGAQPRGTGALRALLGLLGLAALLGAVTLTGAAPLRARPGTREPRSFDTLAVTAAAFAGLASVAAALPLGFGVCSARLAELVGPRELAQCRAGLGGSELLALPGSPGPWWWWIGLAIAASAMTMLRARRESEAPTQLSLAGLRLLGFALLLVALAWGLADHGSWSGSPTRALLAQSGELAFAGLGWLPRWGALAQPLGFALALVLLLTSPLVRSPDPVLASLERLETLIWAGLIAAVFLGGPGLPVLSQRPIPLLTHGPLLALELAVLAVKIAALVYLAARARALLAERGLSHALLVRLHARWTVPLALLNLVAVLIWRMV